MTEPEYTKRFPEWLHLKEQLDAKRHAAPHVNARDIWWASIGENVGSEINGKSDLFSRPVLVLKKLAHGFYFVAPTSTKIKTGSWYAPITFNARDMVVCLHQARSIDHRRLSSRIGQLDEGDFDAVRKSFVSLMT